MEYSELYSRLERLLDAAGVGVLVTVGTDGYPRSRWMTPSFAKGRPGFLYAVTAADSTKTRHVRERPTVEWTFQSNSLDEILSVRGRVRLIDDPQAKAEAIEAIGPRLQIFWRTNPNAKNLVVVETEIEEISSFFPMKNERHSASRG